MTKQIELPYILKMLTSDYLNGEPLIEIDKTALFTNYSVVNENGFTQYYKHLNGEYRKLWEAETHTIINYMKKHKEFRDNLLREIDLEFTSEELKEWKK